MKHTKNLDKEGSIIFGVSKASNLINDITGKLMILKAYKLQRRVLGYVVIYGDIDSDTNVFTKDLHKRINPHLPLYKRVLCNTSKMISISLCARAIRDGDSKSLLRLRQNELHKTTLKRFRY